MRQRFGEELIAEDDHVLEQIGWLTVSVVPDMRFVQKAEPHSVDEFGGGSGGVGSEENRRAEDTFECRDDAAVLFAALGQPERVQQDRSRPEPDDRRLLAYASVARKIGTRRSWPNGRPNSGWPATWRTKCPLRRS